MIFFTLRIKRAGLLDGCFFLRQGGGRALVNGALVVWEGSLIVEVCGLVTVGEVGGVSEC